nr:hypothetical protein [Tanacetum cinerariifolium]
NTLDNLGKFEAKGDEGYFIGYLISSKAFKVFNKRTRRVKENLHVEFLENKAIEKSAGPNWLFDIDSLTKSMNYVPVDAGTNSTNLSSTKDAANQEVKKDVSSLRYIVLPNWAHDDLLEFSSSKPNDESSSQVPKGSGNPNPTVSSSNPLADQMETLTVESLIPTVSSQVLTACLNDSPEPSSKERLILKRVTNQKETPSLDNILSLTNRFKHILGVTTSSNETIGVEADVSNMETSISASPTPTLRIHKDHPKSQIIGFRPIGTKWVLKNKKDEIGIVVRNKARLVAQGHTHEERIDYDEVFAPVARIEAIRLFLAYASFMGFTVYQMDDPAFPAKVYKVEKAMYGLHQAPRAWYATLSKYLLKNGFQRGTIDQTLFIRRQREDFILVQVYVDDIIFGSSNLQHNLVRGLPTKCFENDLTCTACLKGKQHKASLTDDFSRFTWTFFLKSKDETSGILKKFITKIDNLKDLKVKIIRTLIEVARTMLADAKLPATFWAEAVINACYVQNRVLVNKSHNKTPYELFNGRSPTIGFLKPFGCHVMILNTLDNLGKFEEKGDEGYFIGYSMSSQACRVFNKRTRWVEENLHVEFLENKAIEIGSSPNWLFDIDSLTKSMNYMLVDAGTISTNLSGTKDAASQEVKKNVSSLRYIALPNWAHDALLEYSSSKPQDHCSTKVPEGSGNPNPIAST